MQFENYCQDVSHYVFFYLTETETPFACREIKGDAAPRSAIKIYPSEAWTFCIPVTTYREVLFSFLDMLILLQSGTLRLSGTELRFTYFMQLSSSA